MSTNIFRQAQEILDENSPGELTEEDIETINTAMIPLHLLSEYQEMTVNEGLEQLAMIVEKAAR